MSETSNIDSKNQYCSLVSSLYTEGYPETWELFFAENLTELKKISDELEERGYNSGETTVIYPEIENVFRAFIPLRDMKLVILGMDPYFNGSATGLCFSVKSGNAVNASLKNIYAEIERGGETLRRKDGNLEHWREQGCFMLNTALTVEHGKAGSHLRLWKKFTKAVLLHVMKNRKDVGWLLMGNPAIELYEDVKKEYLHSLSENERKEIASVLDVSRTDAQDSERNAFVGAKLPLKAMSFRTSHPSPLGAHKDSKYAKAFIGSKVFRSINDWLGERKIEW